jgi:ABC-type dipeptide/oligopeptide/nickel transport system permease subunit
VSTGAPELIQETEGGIAPGVGMPADIAARSPLQLFWRRIKQDRVTMVSAMFIVFLCVVAVFAGPIISLVGARPPNEQSTAFLDSFGSASGPDFATHTYFGTDGVGRDVFSRTLYGARISLAVALISTFLTVMIGLVLGITAGFYRGWTDTALSRFMDIMLAFPVLLLALGLGAACSVEKGCEIQGQAIGWIIGGIGLLAIISVLTGVFLARRRGRRITGPELLSRMVWPVIGFVLGLFLFGALGGTTLLKISPGLPVVIFVIVIASWPYIARIIRGQTLSLREKEFVEASRALGASDRRIMFRHILPNLVAPIIVYTTLLIPTTILFEAALSFLGVGVQPPTASWGAMISDATSIFDSAWWYMTFPGLALVLTVLAFNLVGDGMQDALNPRSSSR